METTQEIVDRLRAYKEKFADKYGGKFTHHCPPPFTLK